MRLGQERGLNMSGIVQKPIRAEQLRVMLNEFCRVPKESLRVDLADAIGMDRLFIEYQPKYDCARDRFTGVESLTRWRHPSHGIIRPDEFVLLAEETDLIHSLTDWVVRNAAKQAALWHSENLTVEVAVNVSAKDIEDLELPDRLHQHCIDTGLDPETMVLELTETGAMREAVQMMDVLTRLRLKGFRLSIDDFGTGYSSLVQLQRMPFSEIKIDQSFITHMMRDDSCRVIVEIIIDLARKLGLHTVAEGVEDERTLNALIEMGCESVQGYHLSRPIAANGIAPLIREFSAPKLSAVG
jgi:EAL domain-containing protein (putative c-di-GMP-specific phosphodiesterase class I)